MSEGRARLLFRGRSHSVQLHLAPQQVRAHIEGDVPLANEGSPSPLANAGLVVAQVGTNPRDDSARFVPRHRRAEQSGTPDVGVAA